MTIATVLMNLIVTSGAMTIKQLINPKTENGSTSMVEEESSERMFRIIHLSNQKRISL